MYGIPFENDKTDKLAGNGESRKIIIDVTLQDEF